MTGKSKQTALIILAVSILFCACPGCFLSLFGFASALGQGTYDFGADSGAIPVETGVTILIVGLVMLAIPAAIAAFTFWPRKQVDNPDEPVPPAL